MSRKHKSWNLHHQSSFQQKYTLSDSELRSQLLAVINYCNQQTQNGYSQLYNLESQLMMAAPDAKAALVTDILKNRALQKGYALIIEYSRQVEFQIQVVLLSQGDVTFVSSIYMPLTSLCYASTFIPESAALYQLHTTLTYFFGKDLAMPPFDQYIDPALRNLLKPNDHAQKMLVQQYQQEFCQKNNLPQHFFNTQSWQNQGYNNYPSQAQQPYSQAPMNSQYNPYGQQMNQSGTLNPYGQYSPYWTPYPQNNPQANSPMTPTPYSPNMQPNQSTYQPPSGYPNQNYQGYPYNYSPTDQQSPGYYNNVNQNPYNNQTNPNTPQQYPPINVQYPGQAYGNYNPQQIPPVVPGTQQPIPPGYPGQLTSGYPAQLSPGYPPQQTTGNIPPQSPGYPAQQYPGYPPQQTTGNIPPQSPGYPAQQYPGYPPQFSEQTNQYSTGYPPQQPPGYPGQQIPDQSQSQLGQQSQQPDQSHGQQQPSELDKISQGYQQPQQTEPQKDYDIIAQLTNSQHKQPQQEEIPINEIAQMNLNDQQQPNVQTTKTLPGTQVIDGQPQQQVTEQSTDIANESLASQETYQQKTQQPIPEPPQQLNEQTHEQSQQFTIPPPPPPPPTLSPPLPVMLHLPKLPTPPVAQKQQAQPTYKRKQDDEDWNHDLRSLRILGLYLKEKNSQGGPKVTMDTVRQMRAEVTQHVLRMG